MSTEESLVIANLTKREEKVDIKKETNELTTEIKFEIDNTDIKDDNPFRDVQLEVKEELQEGKFTKDIDETKDTEAKEMEVSELKTEEFTLKLEREQEVLPEEYHSQDEGSMDSDDAVALHNVEACLEDEEIKTEDYVEEETHAQAAAAAAAAAPAIRPLIANENVEELIDEVEKRPALYKKDMKQYSDINVKEKLWEEVCAVVINNWSKLNAYEKREKGRDVKKKWSNLRTCFARELKAQKSVKTGQAASKRRPYVYFERMLFLVPCMESRPTEGSIEASESNQNDTDLSEEAQPHRQRKRKAKQGEFKELLLNAHHSKEQSLNARHSKEQLLNAHHSKEQLLNAHHTKKQLLNAHHSKEQLLNAHNSKEQLLLNAHNSKEQLLLNAHYSKEQLLNALHSKEQLLNAHHTKNQLLNAHHSKEQLLNAHHSKEQLLNAHHTKNQLLNAHNSEEQLLNAHHTKNQLLNAHHSEEQLLNAHHSKEDDDTNYCLSLVPFMKELTADEKLEVRIHILKMFQDIKKRRQFQNISFIQPDTSQSQVTRRALQIIKSKHSRPSRRLHTTNQTFTSQPLTASQVSQQQYNITESYPLTNTSSESQTPPPQQYYYGSDIIQYWSNCSESDSDLIDL